MERESVKKLKNWILSLKNFLNSAENTAVVVEGKRDLAALERFGVYPVFALKGMGFHSFSEMLADEKGIRLVILITDFDPEGEEIARKLQRVLSKYNIKVDTSFRESLRETGLKFVEEIPEKLRMAF
ncbi:MULTISPECIES: toprim domain-containing protein [unclassified Desulfurobacterium]|uniref:toprim domain-containing protein n=1 Tax=unclassified Desulfurobacterium TaxID=2639089 RepID=UPI0003B5A52B|nr:MULTISPECIES: toprim domain-containing protein [unclassified Desulfurobacterium]